MPSQGTKYSGEIERLRKQGLSDARIAERLAIGKSIVTRNLHKSRTQQRLGKLLTQAGLYALKQVLVSCEVGWRWMEAERLRLLEGKSTLTAENIGTLMRSQEKALALARAFLGKGFSADELAKAEKQNLELHQVRQLAKELNLKEEDE